MHELTFRRIAIVNRGEAAVRLIHAAAELARERDGRLTTIALHTPAERTASFARLADETHQITSSGNPYLDYDELARALKATGADAAWVGWGFVAEHPEFAGLCDRLGVTFIGPSAEVMRALGDKIGAKRLAEQVGVPVAPWSGCGVESVEEARTHAAEIGYPLLIKAAAGGGGRGIRRVDTESGLATAFHRARDEAGKSFGDPTVFMEHLVTGARHVEVQVAADGQGGAWALGVRDCSIQRRNQKIIEESSSPVLTAEQNEMLGRVACDLVVAAGYRNVGTVEFLYQPASDRFAFLEVNTRLQVEHPITELTTGLDLVKLQLELASGRRLDGPPPPVVGHAIEARLNAEDPSAGFAPASGRITRLRFPVGPGLRVDTGIAEGDRIQTEYDAMVAKVMAWGRDRHEARARLVNGLQRTVVAVESGATNASFLLHLLDRPEVVEGTADTGWLDRLVAEGAHLPDQHGEVAVLVAAAEAYLAAAVYARTAFFAAAVRGRPRATHEPVTTVDCRLRGEQYRLDVQRISPDTYRFEVDGQVLTLSIETVDELESRVRVGDRTHRVRSVTQGRDHLIEVDHVSHTVSRDDASTVRSPSPSLVVAVMVAPGDTVRRGDSLVVLEAMKMETVLTSPFDGTVAEVLCGPSVQVDAGTPLIALDPDDEGSESAAVPGARLDFAALAAARPRDGDDRGRHLRLLEAIRWTVLGFDTQPGVVGELTRRLLADRDRVDRYDPEVVEAELAVITAFSDVGSLARSRRGGEDQDEAHNPTEYFHRYLRSLDVDAEGLPPSFRSKLERAFGHYGVESLAPTIDLQRAAFRLFNAQQQATTHEPLVSAVLELLRIDGRRLDESLATRFRTAIDNLVAATEFRSPNLGALARNVRYRVFDEPAVLAARAAAVAAMEGHLARVRAGTGGEADTVALLECPEAVAQLLAVPTLAPTDRGGGSNGGPAADPMLGVLFRRLYRAVELDGLAGDANGRFELCFARYDRGGRRHHVVATIADLADVADAVALAVDRGRSLLAGAGVGDGLAADCYLRWDGSVETAAAVGPLLERVVARLDLPVGTERLTFTGAAPDGELFHHTYRPPAEGAGAAGAGTLVEDRELRHCHPMIAARLGLPRFDNFALTRLDSPGDVYAYRAVGLDNPRDIRLLAAAEVRDLTPSLDDAGRPVGFPSAERVVAACAAAIRTAQAEHDPDRRLALNRIVLYVWPPFDLPISTLDGVAERLASITAGLDLEGVEVLGDLVQDGHRRPVVARFGFAADRGRLAIGERHDEPIPVLDRYQQDVIASRQRGSIYPYELVERLTGDGGSFIEYEVRPDGTFEPVERPPGSNTAGFVAGLITTPSDRYPEGITRVLLAGDPTRGLASIAEAESRTVIGACDLAQRFGVPVEWYAVSSGARIAMDSGTENMDWISRALRRIVDFTQAGGVINVVVTGINVGAQPYWNAEATMLMHTRGILVMTPDSAMVLTGKQSLDYSGGVSAEDNFGIGGYDRIMGPNGEAQYWAPDLEGALDIVRRHNEHAWVAPGERFARPAVTADDPDRDVGPAPHDGEEFATVGEIFSEAKNPGRKKPFDIRSVMRAVADADREPMERWADLRDGETGVVFEAHLDGQPVVLIGISSRAIPRTGLLPADGPDLWTSGTLFPMSSKKIARAINAASGSRPVIVLANLSGFDGSPESLSRWQLEHGAEIGRAIVNFDGPIVFCVVSRYHGGAFVVFSKTLNDNMEALAVEGTYASVLGGAPAAAVVFAREVDRRTAADPRITGLDERIARAIDVGSGDAAALQAELSEVRAAVRAEKLTEVAAEFDAVHTVERARDVGSVDAIIRADRLRPELIAAMRRGMDRAERTATPASRSAGGGGR